MPHAVPDGAGARMGRTLGELRQTMTVGEFRMWAEYDRISPIGDIRGDILNAQLVSAVYGAQGGKVTIEDAQLQWSAEEVEVNDGGDPLQGWKRRCWLRQHSQ